jgi:hypothetical protein
MSKNYVRIWEKYNGKKLPENMEIHHIDGNHQNNDPNNLVALTIEEHLEIHKKQQDHGAVQAILMRMQRTPEYDDLIRVSASKKQKELLLKGTHNFQKMSRKKRVEVSRNVGLKTLNEKIGIHAINADPILSKQNAIRGRSGLSREKELEMMAKWREKVSGSKWWTHPSGKRKRSKDKPGIEWKEGMKYED